MFIIISYQTTAGSVDIAETQKDISHESKEERENMDNIEKAEKLKRRANISYEDAKEILEQCDWDLLDAVIELEARGKIKSENSGSYTAPSNTHQEVPKNPKQVAETYQNYDKNKKKERSFFKIIWDGIVFLLKKGCENTFIVSKNGRNIMDIPVILLVILMVISLCTVLIIMLIALFCGYRYSFSGPDLGNDKVNSVMNKAGDAAENIKDEFSCKDAYPNSSENREKDTENNKNETQEN